MDGTIIIVTNFQFCKFNGLRDDPFNSTIVQSIHKSRLSLYDVFRSFLSRSFLSIGHYHSIFSFHSISFCQFTHFRMPPKRAQSAPPALAADPSDQVATIPDNATAARSSSVPNTPPANHNPPAFLAAQTTATFPTAPPTPPAPVTVVTIASGPPALSGVTTTATAPPAPQPTARGNARSRWSEPEERALEEAVQACTRRSSVNGDDRALWTRVQNYMRTVNGYVRTETSLRIKYGRDHRRPTGCDERNHARVRNNELQTSVQKPKKQSRSTNDASTNSNEDDDNSPPKKKARKKEPAQSSSTREAPASTSSRPFPPPLSEFRPPPIYIHGITPVSTFPSAWRVPTVNPPITYPTARDVPEMQALTITKSFQLQVSSRPIEHQPLIVPPGILRLTILPEFPTLTFPDSL